MEGVMFHHLVDSCPLPQYNALKRTSWSWTYFYVHRPICLPCTRQTGFQYLYLTSWLLSNRQYQDVSQCRNWDSNLPPPTPEAYAATWLSGSVSSVIWIYKCKMLSEFTSAKCYLNLQVRNVIWIYKCEMWSEFTSLWFQLVQKHRI